MDLRDVRRIAEEEGYVASVCPIHLHVNIRADDLDEDSLTFLCVTEEGWVKEDDGILPEKGPEPIAKTEAELRAWLGKLS